LAFENIMRSLILNVAGNRVVSGFGTVYVSGPDALWQGLSSKTR